MRKISARPLPRIPHSPRFAFIVIVSIIIALALFLSVLSITTYQNPPPLIDNMADLSQSSIHVPEPNEKTDQPGLAVPRSAQESFPGSKNKMRSFEILAEKTSFSINKIIVNQNDIVRIQFTALDKNYDLTLPALGISQKVQKGERKTVEFQAIADGTFDFSCRSCGGNNAMKGILIVVPKT